MVDDKGSVCIIGLGVPPFAHPDDPERSIETALEIREKLLKRSVDSRIGITTGPCFVGVNISFSKFEIISFFLCLLFKGCWRKK